MISTANTDGFTSDNFTEEELTIPERVRELRDLLHSAAFYLEEISEAYANLEEQIGELQSQLEDAEAELEALNNEIAA